MLVKIMCNECDKDNHDKCHNIRIDRFIAPIIKSFNMECPCKTNNHEGFGLLSVPE